MGDPQEKGEARQKAIESGRSIFARQSPKLVAGHRKGRGQEDQSHLGRYSLRPLPSRMADKGHTEDELKQQITKEADDFGLSGIDRANFISGELRERKKALREAEEATARLEQERKKALREAEEATARLEQERREAEEAAVRLEQEKKKAARALREAEEAAARLELVTKQQREIDERRTQEANRLEQERKSPARAGEEEGTA
eukprot:TRINITY_DN8657_c0_g1_i14.p2 TRINITY_DN8657_c0_g1~~TRINITY_DN8657_c0_g1_i14.p2  ORF type:complete len:202 (-),score=48.97 TRINITY_DN8657_c0_g1_i14:5302-5907(-)